MTQPRTNPQVCCAGKARLDASTAKDRAARLRRRNQHVNAYRCPHCSAWHIGFHLAGPHMQRRPPRHSEKDLG
jgi:hypothetical protein